MDAILSCLRAAAEPTRLRLLALCAASDMTVSELKTVLRQSQPRVSRHLKLLCDAGLLDRYREGNWVFYRLADDLSEEANLAKKIVEFLPETDKDIALDRERLTEIKLERTANAERYFKKNALKWDNIRSLHVDEAEVERAILLSFPQNIENFLDIGTGTGRILKLMSKGVARGIGIDVSREMLSVARVNLENAGIRNCHVRHGDMYRLPAREETFEAISIHQVLHYAENPSLVIFEAARVMKPKGLLVIVDFTPHKLEGLRQDHAHIRLGFSEEEITGWFTDAGLLPGSSKKLDGKPLTVGLWTATLPETSQNKIDLNRKIFAEPS